jgi:hypothetical protein
MGVGENSHMTLERPVIVCRILTLRLLGLRNSGYFSDEILETRAMAPVKPSRIIYVQSILSFNVS